MHTPRARSAGYRHVLLTSFTPIRWMRHCHSIALHDDAPSSPETWRVDVHHAWAPFDSAVLSPVSCYSISISLYISQFCMRAVPCLTHDLWPRDQFIHSWTNRARTDLQCSALVAVAFRFTSKVSFSPQSNAEGKGGWHVCIWVSSKIKSIHPGWMSLLYRASQKKIMDPSKFHTLEMWSDGPHNFLDEVEMIPIFKYGLPPLSLARW